MEKGARALTESHTDMFDAVVQAVEHDPSIGKGRGFGSASTS